MYEYKNRISAEEIYIQSLERIEKLHPVPEPEIRYFGDARTSYYKATMQYKSSMGGMINGRRELLKTMKLERQRLHTVRVNIYTLFFYLVVLECIVIY